MKKKGIVLASLLLVVSLLISSCGKERVTEKKELNEKTETRQFKTDNGGEKEQKSTGLKKTQMKGEITVSTFLENELLNAAAKRFMKTYPEVTVTIHNYSENIAQPSEKDYQTVLNTKIMNGNADDIILNSFLPVQKYIEMGAFEDLSGYISQSPELNEKNYFMNVLEAAKQDNGEIYLIPYMARFDVIDFDDELVKEQPEIQEVLKGKTSIRFSEGMKLAEQMVKNTKKDNAYLALESPLQFTTHLLKDRFREFLDMEKKTIQMDTREYKQLLNEVKKRKEEGLFDTDSIDFYHTECHIAEVLDYDVQAAFLAAGSQFKKVATAMPLVDGEGKITINANSCFVLNSALKQKDLSWEFMKYVLSAKIQSLPSVHAIPINRKGFEKAVKRTYKEKSEGSSEKVSIERYREILEDWMQQINACDLSDSSLIRLLEEENEKFIDGKQTVEETAKRLQKKVEQYINE